jgi:uncharacterized protein
MGLLDYFSIKARKLNRAADPYLDCPRCKRQMVKKTRQGVTIDKCPSCGGIWLDKGEMFKILNEIEKQHSGAKTKR